MLSLLQDIFLLNILYSLLGCTIQNRQLETLLSIVRLKQCITHL